MLWNGRTLRERYDRLSCTSINGGPLSSTCDSYSRRSHEMYILCQDFAIKNLFSCPIVLHPFRASFHLTHRSRHSSPNQCSRSPFQPPITTYCMSQDRKRAADTCRPRSSGSSSVTQIRTVRLIISPRQSPDPCIYDKKSKMTSSTIRLYGDCHCQNTLVKKSYRPKSPSSTK